MNNRADGQYCIVLKSNHFRPIGNVWPHADLRLGFGIAETVVHGLAIDSRIKVVFRSGIVVLRIGGCHQVSTIGSRSCNGAGVHQCDRGHLHLGRLGALTIGEVSCSVPDGNGAVGGYIACAEAWSTEGRLHDYAGRYEFLNIAGFQQFHEYRIARRIRAHREKFIWDGLAIQNSCGVYQIFEAAAGAAGNIRLIDTEPAVSELTAQVQMQGGVGYLLLRFQLDLCKNVLGIRQKFPNGVSVARMERESNHWLDRR